MYINTFKYTPKDVSCQLCTEYVKKLGCTALRCPWLAERIDELRKLRKHHPELWEKLMELDRRALAQFGTGPLGQFKQNWSVERLDERFAKEDGQTA